MLPQLLTIQSVKSKMLWHLSVKRARWETLWKTIMLCHHHQNKYVSELWKSWRDRLKGDNTQAVHSLYSHHVFTCSICMYSISKQEWRHVSVFYFVYTRSVVAAPEPYHSVITAMPRRHYQPPNDCGATTIIPTATSQPPHLHQHWLHLRLLHQDGKVTQPALWLN